MLNCIIHIKKEIFFTSFFQIVNVKHNIYWHLFAMFMLMFNVGIDHRFELILLKCFF